MSKRKKVIVIGAGVAGLASASYALKSGYDVHLVEHHVRPGGVCTSWNRGGYEIDGCISWLMGHKPGNVFYDVYEEVGVLRGVDYIRLNNFSEYIDEARGERTLIPSNLDALFDSLRLDGPDQEHVQDVIDAARLMKGVYYPIKDDPKVLGWWKRLSQTLAMGKAGQVWMQYGMSVDRWATRLDNPRAGQVLASMFGGHTPMNFVLMLLAEVEDRALVRVRGGSQNFSSAMARHVRELGGRITYGCDVEEILVEQDRAVGVRCTSGQELRADRVISAAPGFTTIFRMLGGQYTNRDIRDRYTLWPVFPGIALVSFGARMQWPKSEQILNLKLKEPVAFANNDVDELYLRVFNDDDSLAPAGSTVVQASFETKFDFWHDLHHAPRRYQSAKARLADALIGQVERYLPGLAQSVEMTDIATPYTFWRYARSPRGAYEGFLPTEETMDARVEKRLPGLADFYMAGQWTAPGGGVPPSILSGRHTVQLMCRDDGIPFVPK